MRKEGPLVLVEDDSDDQEIMLAVLKRFELTNEVKTFVNGKEALEYLKTASESPFLILSDVNMPVMDGIALKRTIDSLDSLKKKCIPFVFISTSPASFVKQICDLNIQGFFEKSTSFHKLDETVETILRYWSLTKPIN